MNLRVIPATLLYTFDHVDDHNRSHYNRDFDNLAQANTDPVKEWIALQEAKGLAQDSDKIVLQLLSEMYKKLDRIETMLSGEKPICGHTLPHSGTLQGLGYEALAFENGMLVEGRLYYAKVDMPTFPKRSIPLFFESLDNTTGHIVAMHESDRIQWDSYIISRERTMLSDAKGL